jgi:hypothetical protein
MVLLRWLAKDNTSQEAKLNLTKINVATVLLLLILLQYIDITELFFFLDPLNMFVLKFCFLIQNNNLCLFEEIYPTILIYFI